MNNLTNLNDLGGTCLKSCNWPGHLNTDLIYFFQFRKFSEFWHCHFWVLLKIFLLSFNLLTLFYDQKEIFVLLLKIYVMWIVNETSTSQISDRQICEQQLIRVCKWKHPLQVHYTRQGAVVAKVEKGYDMKYVKGLILSESDIKDMTWNM